MLHLLYSVADIWGLAVKVAGVFATPEGEGSSEPPVGFPTGETLPGSAGSVSHLLSASIQTICEPEKLTR